MAGGASKEIGRVAMARVRHTWLRTRPIISLLIDHRTARHCGYEISQQKRKRVEEPFGWGKTIGGLARPMLRGVKLDFSSR